MHLADYNISFYINLPIGGLAAAIVALVFRTPDKAKPTKASWQEKIRQLDLSGIFFLISALICFILALQWGGTTKPWKSSGVIGTLVGFGVLLICFVINEWYLGERSMFPPHLLKQKTLIFLCLFTTVFAGCFFVRQSLRSRRAKLC